MTELPQDLKFYNNTYGLTCVENILLYILNSANIPYWILYYDSFITFSEIIKCFQKEGIYYETFNGLHTIQNIADNEGWVKIHSTSDDIEKLISEDTHIAIMVTPQFIKNKFDRILLREDHYILLSAHTPERITLINDTPKNIFDITVEQLNEIYAGQALKIKLIKHSFDNIDYKSKLKKLLLSLMTNDNIPYIEHCDLRKMRDIVGVLKLSRNRLYHLCNKYFDMEFMDSYLKKLEKIYLTIEYRRLRNQNSVDFVNNTFNDILEMDNKFIIILKEKLTSYTR